MDTLTKVLIGGGVLAAGASFFIARRAEESKAPCRTVSVPEALLLKTDGGKRAMATSERVRRLNLCDDGERLIALRYALRHDDADVLRQLESSYFEMERDRVLGDEEAGVLSKLPQIHLEEGGALYSFVANYILRNRRLGLTAPEKLEVNGRRWFQRSYGNTYFTADIYVNDRRAAYIPESYGYGDYYLQAAAEKLKELGFMPSEESVLWRWASDQGIDFQYSAEDVRRMRDL